MILRVLDAFRPRGATWLGQVISCPPGPSEGPSKMHLLPGGGVRRVHRARSPVPPRLPHFATPWSVHQFAAVVAGAYPPRRPPNAWSPGVPELPGPCYSLVASGTPVGWRGGCLALGLVCGAMRHYCLGGYSALVVCMRRSRLVRGGWGRCQLLCLPCFTLPAPRFLRCVWRAVPSGCPSSSLAGTPFHAVCAFCGLGPDALLVFPACPLCVCALVLSQRLPPPPPPRVGVARAAHAVLVLGTSRAVPLGTCPSACPASRLVRGGWGRCQLLCLPCFTLPAPSFLRCVWRAVPSGCPSSSLAGTPFDAVCAFCGLGPDALLVFPACPLCACALALSQRLPPPPPPRVGVARAPHAVLVLGTSRAVPLGTCPSACPASVPCSVWLAPRGGGPVLFPPTWLGAARSPWGGCGRGDPSPTPARALLRAGLARWLGALLGRHKGARGGASCLGAGHPGSGALPPPTSRPLGRAAGAHYPLAAGAGGAGVGTRQPPHSARSCELPLRAVRAACGCQEGRPLPGCGASGVGRSSAPDNLSFRACSRSPLPTGSGCGGCGRGDPSQTQQRGLLRAGFARCGGGMRVPGGGASCLGVGRPGSGALPPPTTRPFRHAAGAHYPLAVGAG